MTAPPFSVDNSGAIDVTTVLQAAILAAYNAQLVLFLPVGRYLVSGSLWANQTHKTGSYNTVGINICKSRFMTNVLLGSTASLPRRPTIVLRERAPGFSDPTRPKNVLKVTNLANENVNMNQIVRGIDFEIQSGNPGAVALFLHGAQGSTVQDVTVRMAPDALAGFGGGGGSGASHVNIAAFGGQFGVYFNQSEPGPVVAGGTFANQSVSAVATGSHHGGGMDGPLLLVGLHIFHPRTATGPAVSGASYLFDAVVECEAGPEGKLGPIGTVAEVGPKIYGRSHHITVRNTFVRGCAQLVPGTSLSATGGFNAVHEFVAGPIWTDGVLDAAARIRNISTSDETPPDMVAKHVHWEEQSFPSFEDIRTADAVRDCEAKGDGMTDDTTALQTCLNKHGRVFLPRGLFRISRTLELPPNAQLVGLSQTHSVLAAAANFSAAGEATPLVRTAPGAPASLSFIGLVTWWHLAGVFTLDWRSKGGLYRSNYETRVCECLWLTDYGAPNVAHGYLGTYPPKASDCRPGVKLTTPKTQVRGSGSFYGYSSDEDIVMTDHLHYRHLLIGNNSDDSSIDDRLRFYALDLEHAMSEADAELDHARAVDIFGLKKEGSVAIIWVRDSSDINIWGVVGGYSPLKDAAAAPSDFRPYVPSVVRLERSCPVRIAMEWEIGGTTAGSSSVVSDPAALPRRTEMGAREREGYSCDYPLSNDTLRKAHFPVCDWPLLKETMWMPWCGFSRKGGGNVSLLEADGVNSTIVATAHAGVLYQRGCPTML